MSPAPTLVGHIGPETESGSISGPIHLGDKGSFDVPHWEEMLYQYRKMPLESNRRSLSMAKRFIMQADITNQC
jgi:hypothetical protein